MGNSELVGKLTVEGRPLIRRGDLPTTYVRVITDDYFATMGIPLIRGRKFNATDAIGSIGNNRTAIINQTMAERCWPGKDVIGRRFKPWERTHWMEIVGVVGDVYLPQWVRRFHRAAGCPPGRGTARRYCRYRSPAARPERIAIRSPTACFDCPQPCR